MMMIRLIMRMCCKQTHTWFGEETIVDVSPLLHVLFVVGGIDIRTRVDRIAKEKTG